MIYLPSNKNNDMILSMTGFGKAIANYNKKKINIELKSLNGKTADIRFKLSNNFREKEVLLRNIIMDHAKRGKIECSIQIQSGENETVQLNRGLFMAYLREVKDIENEMGIESTDLSSAILRLPNVIIADENEMSADEWDAIHQAMNEALDNLQKFRASEGLAMEQDLYERVTNIASLLNDVKPFEIERVNALKDRMKRHLEDFMGKDNVDKNRYEQEVIYYLEKLDINEEKVRLTQHCTFFLSELQSDDDASGRKLSFITQEMGREINTLGAKAQHTEIQKIVVQMKDDLEKIKEQLANIV